MKHKYTIGEVQKKTGISSSALRFYDDIGLVKPSYTDENTGYRYYSYQEFWQLEIVKICKSMGIPLKELRKVLETNDPSRFVELMLRQRENAQKKLDAMQKLVSDLNWMAERYQAIEDCEPGAVRLKQLPERKVISVQASDEMDSDALHFALQSEAENILNKRNGIWREYGYELSPCSEKGKLIWESEFLIVNEGELSGEEVVQSLPAGEYACFMCKPFSQDQCIDEIISKIKKEYGKKSIERVFAMEAALYFYDWQDEIYEIQLLMK
ncbi:MAG: MerR family transcriptional regulator [Lachnospiraceae bacterium]